MLLGYFSRGRKALAMCSRVMLSLAIMWANQTSADTSVNVDVSDLRAAQSLSDLPPDLVNKLREHGLDRGISDLGYGAGVSLLKSATAWYLIGGANESRGLVAIQYITAREKERFHARSFSKLNGSWSVGEEWIIASQPHTLQDLAGLIHDPETVSLTAKWQERLRVDNVRRRIYQLEPSRRYSTGPLREVDINDEEIREIQAVVQELLPGAMVMISGVSKGCPCEEGPNCSAQVWTAIHLPDKTKSLELSQVSSHWTIGVVQRWYLESENLKIAHFASYAEYNAAQSALEMRFPLCASTSVPR
jgi:hypothetical protein